MKQARPVFLFSSIAVVALIFFSHSLSKYKGTLGHEPAMRGVCWVAGDSIADHNIDHLAQIGSNWISQTPFGYMENYQSSQIRVNYDHAWWGETDRGIRHTAELAKKKGIKSMLKPHIWMPTGSGKWRSDIEMTSEEAWDKWFENYGDWIIHYAELAEDCGIEAICIGTELHSTTVGQPDRWRSLIQKVRKVYSGQLTYAANWYKEFEEIEFWDDLDFIGIQAYFPLSQSRLPEKSELIESWGKHKISLKKIAERFDKKIVFTEIGYKNTADSAIEPWTWPQQLSKETEISEKVQEDCYNALFESIWHEPWFDGLFIWKWFHTTYRHKDYQVYNEERRKRREEWAKRRGRDLLPHVYFSPQNTKALEILSQWYHGEKRY